MSKVKIQGNASGTGVLTIAAPNTNTDRTITLPDGTGTLLTSISSSDMPAGSVLQVSMSEDSGYAYSNSTSFVQINSVSITGVVAGSTVYIEASINHLIEHAGYGIFAIFKGSTELARSSHNTNTNGGWRTPLNTIYAKDTSPSVGSNTYTIKMLANSSQGLYYNYSSGDTHCRSFYKLTEVAG